MPAATRPTTSTTSTSFTTPVIPLVTLSTSASTSRTTSDSQASSFSETSLTSTATSTVSCASSPPLSANSIVSHQATTFDPRTPDISTQVSASTKGSSGAWCRYVFAGLQNRCQRMQAAAHVSSHRFHRTILAGPNSTTISTSSPPFGASSSTPGSPSTTSQHQPAGGSSSPHIVPLLKTWWKQPKAISKLKDFVGSVAGVATLLMTIFSLAYYAQPPRTILSNAGMSW